MSDELFRISIPARNYTVCLIVDEIVDRAMKKIDERIRELVRQEIATLVAAKTLQKEQEQDSKF